MRCSRCKQEFANRDLRPPSMLLRVVAFPYLLLMRLGPVLKESDAAYCRPCRRQMNVCLLFLGFLVVLFALLAIIAIARK
jgi:hypothetical protein